MQGVVQTAEGLPLYHEVFDGNTFEVQTLKPTLEKIVRRFPVKRVIAVAERGLLSVENLEELKDRDLARGRQAGVHPGSAGTALQRVDRLAGTTAEHAVRKSQTRKSWAKQAGTHGA